MLVHKIHNRQAVQLAKIFIPDCKLFTSWTVCNVKLREGWFDSSIQVQESVWTMTRG